MEFGLDKNLKPFHWITSILTIPAFGFFSVFYGWISYATLSDRNGLWGNLWSYYDLTKTQFLLFRFIVSITLIALIVFQIKYLSQKKIDLLNKTLLISLVFVVLWITGELYLNAHFNGKG